MMNEIIIKDRPLKEFFELFDEDESVEIIELGDTLYPLCSFVDQNYFEHINTVRDLFRIAYDFKGLIIFNAKVGGLLINYHNNHYTIKGSKKEIERIKYMMF